MSFSDILSSYKKEIEIQQSYKDQVNTSGDIVSAKLHKISLILSDIDIPRSVDISQALKDALETQVQELSKLTNEALFKQFPSLRMSLFRYKQKFNESFVLYNLESHYLNSLHSLLSDDLSEKTIKISLIGQRDSLLISSDSFEKELGVNTSEYLMAFLNFADFLVSYSTKLIIKLTSMASPEEKLYSIISINSKILEFIQSGFKLLELKNDSLRRKYDGLKYSFNRMNEILYDLSIRGLIKINVEIS